MSLLTVASYNIHQCIGRDRRWHPGRIARVLQELDADIVGLQEVHSRAEASDEAYQMKYLADVTGFEAVAGTTMLKRGSEYGNVLLSRFPVTKVRRLILACHGGSLGARLTRTFSTARRPSESSSRISGSGSGRGAVKCDSCSPALSHPRLISAFS
jgi:endonuclease/exonuclease/phosphatase family metal-dependent hydrolase